MRRLSAGTLGEARPAAPPLTTGRGRRRSCTSGRAPSPGPTWGLTPTTCFAATRPRARGAVPCHPTAEAQLGPSGRPLHRDHPGWESPPTSAWSARSWRWRRRTGGGGRRGRPGDLPVTLTVTEKGYDTVGPGSAVATLVVGWTPAAARIRVGSWWRRSTTCWTTGGCSASGSAEAAGAARRGWPFDRDPRRLPVLGGRP